MPWSRPTAEDHRIRAAAAAPYGCHHRSTRIRRGTAGRRRETARGDQGRGSFAHPPRRQKRTLLLLEERDAEKAAERAEKDKAKNAQKRQKVLTLCRDRNATAVGLVLLNDPINKRKDVQAALDRAGVKEAERIGSAPIATARPSIGRFDSLNDTYVAEPAYDTYAKLNDRGLNVAFVPVPADDGDDERLEALAELRDRNHQCDVCSMAWRCADLLTARPRRSWSTCTHRLSACRWRAGRRYLKRRGGMQIWRRAAKLIFGAVSLVTAFTGVSLTTPCSWATRPGRCSGWPGGSRGVGAENGEADDTNDLCGNQPCRVHPIILH